MKLYNDDLTDTSRIKSPMVSSIIEIQTPDKSHV